MIAKTCNKATNTIVTTCTDNIRDYEEDVSKLAEEGGLYAYSNQSEFRFHYLSCSV